MVNTGKREDGLLDFVNNINGRIKMAVTQIEIFREKGLTENEISMLNTLSALLQEDVGK